MWQASTQSRHDHLILRASTLVGYNMTLIEDYKSNRFECLRGLPQQLVQLFWGDNQKVVFNR
jgi:hypothetical protein